jgi:hypothetical protein
MVVWAVVIPLFWYVTARNVGAGALGAAPDPPAGAVDVAARVRPEPGTRAGSAMAQVDRFDRLFQVVVRHTREAGASIVSVDSLCAAAAAHLGVSAVAVTTPAVAGQAQTLGVHGTLARELEELQVTLGVGPSLQAIADGVSVLVPGLRADADAAARWPEFTQAALAAGVESLYMLPMRVGAARFGVFALYLQRIADVGPGPLTSYELADADVLAAIGLDVLLTHAGVLTPDWQGDSSEDRRFFDDRPEIHQATGMVSVQLEVDLGTALLRIRARAYAEERQLSDLAADLVSRRVRFTRDPETESR